MRSSTSALPQSRTLMRGLILGDKYAKEAAQEMTGREVGTGTSALAALNDAGALWTVEKALSYQMHPKDGFVPVPNTEHVRRSDNYHVTGTVSSSYAVFQNRQMGEWADLLVDVAESEHVGAVVTHGGRRVMVLLKLRPSQLAESIGDNVIPTMVVGTGHDGSTSLFAAVMGFREICTNTLHWSFGATRSVKIRHTRNMDFQVAEARRALNLAERWSESFDKEIERLLDIEVNRAKAEELLEQVWPITDEELKPRTRSNNEGIHAGIQIGRAHV